MREQQWVDFWCDEFHEYPRRFKFVHQIHVYYLQSKWDAETLTYSPFYTVSIKEWNKFRELFAVPVVGIDFDKTRKKILDISFLKLFK